ncbi:MAG: hypothetical protein A3G43_13920 [Ignavibacteria bacterium RIFCSPLOWO2_12_FULL_56_21]|nr:MAG: hypothetical protein A2X68_06980 [Ignavibacteria bacterium GWC2_56_12]OGU75669.1 MAG: hypothetical protein A3G43_13920 [Ignavibacteria bacterium RIFCSPLOWO2_12_FULL_56_21]HAV24483.1 amidohydrolase family protein [Bacteroidota bacterium]
MKTITSLILILAIACLSAQDRTAPAVTAVKCGKLLNVRTGAYASDVVVLIERGRISAVGSDVKVPEGAKIIDLSRATVLPGLIDAHTHLLQNYKGTIGGDDPNMILTVAQIGTTLRALLGAMMGREMLEAGFTTVRDLGNSGVNGDVALRDAINAGMVPGPRIVASTRALSAAGGQFGRIAAEVQPIIAQEYVVVAGVDEARKAVRQAFYDGAECIKVIVNTGTRVLGADEMKAIVEEASRVGKKVSAHAIGDLATRVSAQAGVSSIEHAYTIPDDVLKLMAEKKIYLVPTDYPADFYLSLDPNVTPEEKAQREEGVKRFTQGSRERLARALKFGVPVAAGSDEYYAVPGKTRGQAALAMFRAYAEAGMTPLQVLQSATVNAADLLGWDPRIGTIETGKFADMIAVEGDPLKDITLLEKTFFVMKGGAVIRNTFVAHE